MEIKHLDFDVEIKQVSDEGGFEGYASTAGNIDRGGDMIEKGAFKRSLDKWKSRGKMPKMLWQHDPGQPVGVWDDMQEDEKGLFVKGRVLMELQKGREIHTLMKNGAIDSMSIGYKTLDADFAGPNADVRVLKEVELWEVSLVTFPMNEEAAITHVKHLQSRGEAARILRKEGVPGKFAELITLYGWDEACKRVDGRRKADDHTSNEGVSLLLETLKKRQELF